MMSQELETTPKKSRCLKTLMWRGLHYLIILHLLIEVIYCAYMIFSVLQPNNGGGPLMDRALTMPFEQMVTRRLYALECWVATGALSIYLAITEIAPRMRADQFSTRG
jgi:hypothetical protein